MFYDRKVKLLQYFLKKQNPTPEEKELLDIMQDEVNYHDIPSATICAGDLESLNIKNATGPYLEGLVKKMDDDVDNYITQWINS